MGHSQSRHAQPQAPVAPSVALPDPTYVKLYEHRQREAVAGANGQGGDGRVVTLQVPRPTPPTAAPTRAANAW